MYIYTLAGAHCNEASFYLFVGFRKLSRKLLWLLYTRNICIMIGDFFYPWYYNR